MPLLVIVDAKGQRHELAAKSGASVMEAARDAGLMAGECNGSMACATCHVIVAEAWADKVGGPEGDEEDMLDACFNVRATSRLCCQITMSDDFDGLTVSMP
jgi:2Fe-2S ferredoxin